MANILASSILPHFPRSNFVFLFELNGAIKSASRSSVSINNLLAMCQHNRHITQHHHVVQCTAFKSAVSADTRGRAIERAPSITRISATHPPVTAPRARLLGQNRTLALLVRTEVSSKRTDGRSSHAIMRHDTLDTRTRIWRVLRCALANRRSAQRIRSVALVVVINGLRRHRQQCEFHRITDVRKRRYSTYMPVVSSRERRSTTYNDGSESNAPTAHRPAGRRDCDVAAAAAAVETSGGHRRWGRSNQHTSSLSLYHRRRRRLQ